MSPVEQDDLDVGLPMALCFGNRCIEFRPGGEIRLDDQVISTSHALVDALLKIYGLKDDPRPLVATWVDVLRAGLHGLQATMKNRGEQ